MNQYAFIKHILLKMILTEIPEQCDYLINQKRDVISGLRSELIDLECTYTTEHLQHMNQRIELVRRIAEHATELHHEYKTSLRELQVK